MAADALFEVVLDRLMFPTVVVRPLSFLSSLFVQPHLRVFVCNVKGSSTRTLLLLTSYELIYRSKLAQS